MVNRFALAALFACGVVYTSAATAQDAAPSVEPATLAWTQDRDKISSVDSADAGSSADFYTFSRLIKSSGGDGPIVILNCSFNSRGNTSITAGFQLDPNNTYEENPKTRLRTNSISGHLTIATSAKRKRFVYHARLEQSDSA